MQVFTFTVAQYIIAYLTVALSSLSFCVASSIRRLWCRCSGGTRWLKLRASRSPVASLKLSLHSAILAETIFPTASLLSTPSGNSAILKLWKPFPLQYRVGLMSTSAYLFGERFMSEASETFLDVVWDYFYDATAATLKVDSYLCSATNRPKGTRQRLCNLHIHIIHSCTQWSEQVGVNRNPTNIYWGNVIIWNTVIMSCCFLVDTTLGKCCRRRRTIIMKQLEEQGCKRSLKSTLRTLQLLLAAPPRSITATFKAHPPTAPLKRKDTILRSSYISDIH